MSRYLDIKLDSLDFYNLRLIDETGSFQEINLQEELAINENELDREMLEQPSKYVYWSSILEKIRYFKEDAELQLELLIGELDRKAREELSKNGGKPTKDAVDAYIKRTEEYKQQKTQCNYYDYLVRRIQFIVKAFEQRKDMLQSINKQKTNEKTYGQGAGSKQEQTGYYDPLPPQNYVNY